MTEESKLQREGFVFYKSFRDAIANLPKENQLNAFLFITEYGLNWKNPDLSKDPIAFAIFTMAKSQIDANYARYLNSLKGWRPRKEKNQTETKPKRKEKDKEKENVKVKVKVKDKKLKKFNEIINYSKEFEKFWKEYPKKKWKQNAREARENAIKWWNDPEKIIKKAWEYATEIRLKRIEEKFIKYAQWWLNEWRFDDDYYLWEQKQQPDLSVLY